MATVEQVFSQLKLPEWWKLHISKEFDGDSEKGTDYNFGYMGAPVGAIAGGKVVYVGDGGMPGTGVGQIVQVLTSGGSLVHYQHLKTASVHLGQTIKVGDVVGAGGGCPSGAYWADPSRTDCQWTDQYSTGEHIEVRFSPSYNASGGVWQQNWIPPKGEFSNLAGHDAASSGGASSGSSGGSSAAPAVDFGAIGSKIGVFVLAVVLLIFGLYLMFQKQVNSAVSNGVKTAAKVAIV